MEQKKLSERIAKIVVAIQEAASLNDTHPSEVTKRMICDVDPELSIKKIEDAGGIELIRKANFPVDSKDLPVIKQHKNTTKYISELEDKLGTKQLNEQTLIDVLSKVESVKIKSYKAKRGPKDGLQRDTVAILSDPHYGLIVSPEEVGGVNSYGWLEASRRTAHFVKQICDYKPDHRNEVRSLHLVLNGDVITGIIHGIKDRSAEFLTLQINGAIHILAYTISRIAENYKTVVIDCISGNHDDMEHRRDSGKRVHTHKWDSYANVIFFALSAMFKDTHNVHFNVTKGLYVDFNTLGGRVLCSHGDTLFNKELGNVGTKINTKGLGDAIRKFNAGEISRGKEPIKMLVLGHVHTSAHFITEDGIDVVVVPSLSGVDPFSYSMTINNNVVRSLIFESTNDFMFGDSRLVRVDVGDKDETLDNIIPVYENGLAWEK